MKIGEIMHWAAGMLNPAERKSVSVKEVKTVGRKQTQLFRSKSVGRKGVKVENGFERLVMSIELR